MNMLDYTYRKEKAVLTRVNPNDIDSIALHHFASVTAINNVTDWHMDNNGWIWNGYGYIVDFDGSIYKVRGYEYKNSAVKGHNSHILSIAFRGDYNLTRNMPKSQFRGGVKLIKYLKDKLQNVKTIAGHNYFMETTCPGKHFPLINMIEKVNKNISLNEAKEILQKNGIISSIEYWNKVIDTTYYVDKLLINMANFIEEFE